MEGCVKVRSMGWSADEAEGIVTVMIMLAGHLCGLEHLPQHRPPVAELLPWTWSGIISFILVRCPKKCRTSSCATQKCSADTKLPKPRHRIIPAFCTSMTLLNATVHSAAVAVNHTLPEFLPDGTRATLVPISRHLRRATHDYFKRGGEMRFAASIARCALNLESTRFPSA